MGWRRSLAKRLYTSGENAQRGDNLGHQDYDYQSYQFFTGTGDFRGVGSILLASILDEPFGFVKDLIGVAYERLVKKPGKS